MKKLNNQLKKNKICRQLIIIIIIKNIKNIKKKT